MDDVSVGTVNAWEEGMDIALSYVDHIRHHAGWDGVVHSGQNHGDPREGSHDCVRNRTHNVLSYPDCPEAHKHIRLKHLAAVEERVVDEDRLGVDQAWVDCDYVVLTFLDLDLDLDLVLVLVLVLALGRSDI